MKDLEISQKPYLCAMQTHLISKSGFAEYNAPVTSPIAPVMGWGWVWRIRTNIQ